MSDLREQLLDRKTKQLKALIDYLELDAGLLRLINAFEGVSDGLKTIKEFSDSSDWAKVDVALRRCITYITMEYASGFSVEPHYRTGFDHLRNERIPKSPSETNQNKDLNT